MTALPPVSARNLLQTPSCRPRDSRCRVAATRIASAGYRHRSVPPPPHPDSHPFRGAVVLGRNHCGCKGWNPRTESNYTTYRVLCGGDRSKSVYLLPDRLHRQRTSALRLLLDHQLIAAASRRRTDACSARWLPPDRRFVGRISGAALALQCGSVPQLVQRFLQLRPRGVRSSSSSTSLSK